MKKLTSKSFQPSLLELERRDTPAWWSVAVPTPADGTLGDTSATHQGEITAAPGYSIENGTVSVFADTASAAVTKALAGTISVTINDETTDYVFSPDTVGSTTAEHKPYFVVVTGTAVAIAFEDMAGQAGCDYDYNDRSWSGVTVAGRAAPIIFENTYSWTGLAGNATVTATITEVDEGTYKWNYHLHNNSYVVGQNGDWGIGVFVVGVTDTTAMLTSGSSLSVEAQADFGAQDGENLFWSFGSETNPGVEIGQEADFWFTTLPLPVAATSGSGWEPGVSIDTSGGCVGPADPVADITIDGTIPVNGVQKAFDATTEDTVGGLVVRRAEDNNAPRKKITVNKLTVNGAPAMGGAVEITIPGKVELYDAAEKGNKIASGKVIQNADLPINLWVQGVTASDTMRDIKIKAQPVGVTTGSDDVAFTVAWVELSMKFADKVTPENTAKAEYMKITSDKSDNLKAQFYQIGGTKFLGAGFETKGVVSPADFNYPGSTVSIARDVNSQGFQDNDTYLDPVLFSDLTVTKFGNDKADDIYRDDSPPLIFDIDAPGAKTGPAPLGKITRYRGNFKNFAVIDVVRASVIKLSNARVSAVQIKAPEGDEWSILNSPTQGGIVGDNGAGEGHIKLTYDLK